jgi:beta-galactosidase
MTPRPEGFLEDRIANPTSKLLLVLAFAGVVAFRQTDQHCGERGSSRFSAGVVAFSRAMAGNSNRRGDLSRRSLLKSTSATVALGAAAGPRAIAQPAGAASAQRLSKGWEYRRGDLGGVWEVWRPPNQGEAPTGWDAVAMPHCWNALDAVDPDQGYYQGPGWYRLHVVDQNPFAGGRTLLSFHGAGQKTEVYLFEEKIAQHVGGYDEFVVDITDAAARYVAARGAKSGLPLAVRCDNSRDMEMIPSNESDFCLYGGLYRPVDLVFVPAISLERVHVDGRVDPATAAAQVTVRARLYNPRRLTDGLDIAVEVTAPDGQVVHRSSRKLAGSAPAGGALAAFSLPAPKLWSPEQPDLYRCTVTVTSTHGRQQVSERFGLRFYEFVKHGPFKLNGKRLLLRGTHRHEDHAGVAAAIPEDVIRKEMTLIKQMGANFIRLGHYQQSRAVLEACDELGILVWEEIPWCRGGLGGERFQRQARDMLRAMIDQHRNHPSVVLWGLGNENDWKPGDFEQHDEKKIRAFMIELNQLAHELDPSRKTSIRRCDFCKDVVDVYSPSIWAGWYRGQYTEYKSASEEEMKKVDHFLHVEWGGDSHAGRHAEDPDRAIGKVLTGQGTDERGLDFLRSGGQARASRDGDWSETYICNLFDWHLKEQETMDWLTGTAQWVFKDFCTPLRPDNPVPRVNQKGVCERDLTLKEGYYVFQSYWTATPMVRLYGHSWRTRWGGASEHKMVKVYSNCPSAELFVGGVSQGVRQRRSEDFPAAGLRWMVSLRPGENRLKVVGRKGDVTVTDELTWGYETRHWGAPARLTLQRVGKPKDGEVVTVEARLSDAKGVPCLDARTVVRFGVTGDGRLVDNLGTPRACRQLELYNGRATIGVRLPAGRAMVSVSAKGLPTAFLSVPVT